MSETRVEGAILIVQMRPSMKPPGTLKSGAKDIQDMLEMRKRKEELAEQQRQEIESERRRSAQALAVKQRQVHWQQSMADMRLAAARRQSAAMSKKVAEEKRTAIGLQLKSAADKTQKADLAAMLAAAEKELEQAASDVAIAEQKAHNAKESEAKALKAKITAEMKVGEQNWKLAKMYGEKQFMRGLLRAKEAAALYQSMDGAAPAAAEEVEVVVKEAQVAKTEHKALGDISVEDCIKRFASVVGTQEDWAKKAIQPEDTDFLHQCMAKMITLCETSKKNRKAAAAAGFFEEISKMMWRYEGQPCLLIHCTEAIAAVCKKAESDKIQDESQGCMFKLVETMDNLHKPAIEAVQSITRNHRENTMKLVRAGGLVRWLDEKSSIVPPDQPVLEKKK